MSSPKVTIVVSSFNRPQLCTCAIESVKDQTLTDFECIIADDDSDEETRAAIVKAVGDDARFKILWQAFGPVASLAERQKLTRYSGTINAALAIARGEYVVFLPDDDQLMPQGNEARAKFLDENPAAMVAYGKTRSIPYDIDRLWDTKGRPRATRFYPKEGEIDPATGRIVELSAWAPGVKHPMGGHLDHNQFMIRRSVLERISGPEYWPVRPLDIGCGDADFLKRLDEVCDGAHAVDACVSSKVYHGWNVDKARNRERRE